jgi:hypothetical protein
MRFGTEPLKDSKNSKYELLLLGALGGAVVAFFLARSDKPHQFSPPVENIEKSIDQGKGQASETATPTQIKGGSPSERISKAEFQHLTEEALKTLPKKSDLKGLGRNEVHQTPIVFVRNIEPLVKINRLVRDNPDLKETAFSFYKKCAAQDELMTAVRARCLSHLRKMALDAGQDLDLSVFPDSIRKLSEFIPF